MAGGDHRASVHHDPRDPGLPRHCGRLSKPGHGGAVNRAWCLRAAVIGLEQERGGDRAMKRRRTAGTEYAVCVKNQGYRASLILRKIYKVVPDSDAAKHGLIRVVDESGEDYLYSAKLFVPIQAPKTVGRILSAAT